MSKPGSFKLADVAMVTTDEPIDWKALFETEVKRRASLEGQLSNLRNQLVSVSEAQIASGKAVERNKHFINRIEDMRRGIAARLVAALLIRDGRPQGEDMFSICETAVDLTDALINTLLATKRLPRGDK